MGMALKTGVSHSRVTPTRPAVTTPARPDLAPVYLATAERAKEPVVGYELKAAPARLAQPKPAQHLRLGIKRICACAGD